MPHSVFFVEPIAVVDSFANASAEEVKQHVRKALGEDYALGGVVCLKQVGFVDFPVNATHKIIRSEVQEAVVRYWRQRSVEVATTERNAGQKPLIK